jgi:carbon-monoxide dehydrogenase medium subunit
MTGIFTTVLEPDELLVGVRIPKRSPRARYGYWKFCRKAGEFAQAIGAAVRDPDSGESRAVMGAVNGPPILVADPSLLPDIGDDAYSRQLHAVALKRAVAQVVQ